MTYRVTDADRNVRATDADRRTFTITVQQADSAPRFTQAVASRSYTVGTAIPALVLPAARGGDGALTYALTPAVPGLTFDARLRRLTGTATRAGTYRMTYRVTDADRNIRATDVDTRTFTITVLESSAPRGFAPVDEAAFNALVVGRAALGFSGDLPYDVYISFFPRNRFNESGSPGSYSYRNTGANAATLTLNNDYGNRCVARLTFTSPSNGRFHVACQLEVTSGSGAFEIL